LWVNVGLMTRTNRGRRFEADLNDATSLQDLNRIAAGYESALMWKMLGPHQGLRLERIRTELERDKFSAEMKALPENKFSAEMKALPEIKDDVSPPSEPPAAPPADVEPWGGCRGKFRGARPFNQGTEDRREGVRVVHD